jgi:DNA repair protein RecO (recombination protein O)
MRLLARDDAHPRLFDLYTQVVQVLATAPATTTAAALRAFELLLLRGVGLLPDLAQQTLTLAPVLADAMYSLVPEGGVRSAGAQEANALPGAMWLSLRDGLDSEWPLPTLLRECAQWPSHQRQALQTQLRQLLHYHCGVQTLRTRQVMLDVQAF